MSADTSGNGVREVHDRLVERLKKQAKALRRRTNMPLSRALDIMAEREGYTSWAVLMFSRREAVEQKGTFLGRYPRPKAEGVTTERIRPMQPSPVQHASSLQRSHVAMPESRKARTPTITYRKRKKIVVPESA